MVTALSSCFPGINVIVRPRVGPKHRLKDSHRPSSSERIVISSRSPFLPAILLPPSGLSSDLEALLKQQPVLDLAQKVIQPPANRRILSRFLAVGDWISHVEGMVPADILQIVTIPDDEWHSALRQHAFNYMQSIQKLLTPMEANMKRRMATYGP